MESLDAQSLAAATLVGGALVIGAFSYLGKFIGNSSLPKQNEDENTFQEEKKPRKKVKKKSKASNKEAVPAIKKEATPKPKKIEKKVVAEDPKVENTTNNEGKTQPKKKKRRKKKKKVKPEEADSDSSSDDFDAKPKKKEPEIIKVKTAADIALKQGFQEEEGWSTVPVRTHNKTETTTQSGTSTKKSDKVKKAKEFKESVDLGSHVYVILGEGGSTIANIQDVSGAKVAVNKEAKSCVVSGDEDSVEVAVQLIKSLISNQARETIEVDTQLDKAILTKSDTKQSIRELSGAKVEYSFGKTREDAMTVIVTGESHKVETAKSLIHAYLDGKTPGGEDGVKRVKVTAFQGRILIGQKGSQITALQKESGASINVEFKENEDIAVVTAIGEPEQIESGMELIQNFLREHNLRTTVELDPNARPGVLLQLNDLRREIPNLQVEVSDDRSHIKLCGSGSGLSQGSKMIQQWIEDELGAPKILSGEKMEQIDLGDAAGKVIGKSKSVLNSILSRAEGSKIAIKQGTLCYIYGTASGVSKAFKEIKAIVERHQDTVAKSQQEQQQLQTANWVVLGEEEENRLLTKDTKTLVAPASDWGGYKLAQMQGW